MLQCCYSRIQSQQILFLVLTHVAYILFINYNANIGILVMIWQNAEV